MKFRLLRKIAVLCSLMTMVKTCVLAAPAVSARYAALLDGDTGQVIWQYHGSETALMASTTKIMTGFLVARDCPLDQMVTIPAQAAGIEGSSLNLQAGEERTVEELLYGMMLHSGNDAALALAIFHSGSEEAFIAAMNQQARQWGLTNTSFANPHGLDAPMHYTTAVDLAKLAACAMKEPVFAQVVGTKSVCLDGRVYTNHNKLLWQLPSSIGVKTGYTRAAGRILVSCARQNGRTLVAVTMDDGNDWQDHAGLFSYGFGRYDRVTVAEERQTLALVPVLSGERQWAAVCLAAPLQCDIAPEERWQVTLHLPQVVYAPLTAGEIAGEAVVLVDGVELASSPLVWRDTIVEGAWDGRTVAKTDFPIWSRIPAASGVHASGGSYSCQW